MLTLYNNYLFKVYIYHYYSFWSTCLKKIYHFIQTTCEKFEMYYAYSVYILYIHNIYIQYIINLKRYMGATETAYTYITYAAP